MLIGTHDVNEKVFVIAEIGANHEGSLDEAKRLIEAAARCGVDAVKFQTYRADKIVAVSETQRRAHFRRLELTDTEFQTLAQVALEHGVMFLSTPFDIESVDLLDPLMPAFKIASGDLTATPLVAHIATKGKPVIMSTGMAGLEEIFDAVGVIEDASPLGTEVPLVLLHCVSAYPTPDAHANLNAIPYLRDRTGRPVGYSDHTLGIEACLAAVALGARVIEKHFTFDKNRATMRDHQLSADPTDLAQMVRGIRRIEAMLGESAKGPYEVEVQNRTSMRRSLAARTAIRKGELITPSMLTVLRPGTGLSPSMMQRVIGQRAMRDVDPGEVLTQDAVAEMESCAR
jgi:sialic acid synthase SpsE